MDLSTKGHFSSEVARLFDQVLLLCIIRRFTFLGITSAALAASAAFATALAAFAAITTAAAAAATAIADTYT